LGCWTFAEKPGHLGEMGQPPTGDARSPGAQQLPDLLLID
jgi:hypothetical protein